MKTGLVSVGAWAAAIVATAALAQDALQPKQLAPSELEWVTEASGVKRVVIAGSNEAPGIYAYRAWFPNGFRNDPHFHPDNRIVTVISGTLSMGYGERFDERAMRVLPAGSVWTEPAGRPHFVWARDGDVVIQIVGMGPSGTTQVAP